MLVSWYVQRKVIKHCIKMHDERIFRILEHIYDVKQND